MMQGIFDMTIDEYHSSEGLSKTGLVLFKKSPLHYWNEYRNSNKEEDKKTPALILGNAVHSYILEPEKFNERYFVLEKTDLRTKEGKKKFEEMSFMANGKELLSIEMFNEVEKLGQAFLKNDLAREFLKEAQIEKSIYWRDCETNVLLKCRPDIWLSNILADIKTTNDASEREFQRSIVQYGYHIQAAMMQDGIEHVLHRKISSFAFLVMEKSPPYAMGIYMLDESAIERGREEYKNLLREYVKYEEKAEWPSYQTKTIGLPAYY